jgi:hypothetical protein
LKSVTNYAWIAWIAALALSGCGGAGSPSAAGLTPPPILNVTVSPRAAAFVVTTQTQQFTANVTGNGYGTPAFWQNKLYFAGSLDGTAWGDDLTMFSFNPSTGPFETTAVSQSSHYFNFPGATPSVSSQGTPNGIVWAIDSSAWGYAYQIADGGATNCFKVPVPAHCTGPAVLHAYDATNFVIDHVSTRDHLCTQKCSRNDYENDRRVSSFHPAYLCDPIRTNERRWQRRRQPASVVCRKCCS